MDEQERGGWWILVGMMGAGKSTVGQELARLSGRRFLDTDKMLQQRFGRPIASIFEIYGERAFRDHETSILSEVTGEPGVLSTGGGILTREENREILRTLGRTIYLRVSVEGLEGRLSKSKRKRPLLASEDWPERLRTILDGRQEIYMQADLVFPTEFPDTATTAEHLYAKLREEQW